MAQLRLVKAILTSCPSHSHINVPSLSQLPKFTTTTLPSSISISAPISCRKNNSHSFNLAAKKDSKKVSRSFVTVSFPGGQWQGDWTHDYVLTLKDLQLDDLAEDGRKYTQLHVTLTLHKHAGVGVSADGRIATSIARKCRNCSSSYFGEIDATFSVWILQSSRDDPDQHPELGGDPSVIYVKPGEDAVLDSLIQETIRLQLLVKETCSGACEKADTKLHYIGEPKTASLDRRWSKLIGLRKSYRQNEG